MTSQFKDSSLTAGSKHLYLVPLQKFSKYENDPTTVRLWLRQVERSVHSRVPRAGQASNETILALVAHPPRGDGNNPPGYNAAAAADNNDYAALAAPRPGAAGAADRALHAAYQGDIEVGAALVEAITDTDLSFILDEDGDMNRFSALMYRIRVSVPTNLEHEEAEIRQLLLPTDQKGDGVISDKLITIDHQLDQKRQMSNFSQT